MCEEGEGGEGASEPLSMHQSLSCLHSAEEETVFVGRVLRSKIVKVEDTNPEDSEVGTHTQVGHNDD